MPDEALLSKTHKYIVLGPDEYIWLFAYEEKLNVVGDQVWGWQPYFKRPDKFFVATSRMWGEKEVYDFIQKYNSHKLDDNDQIDMYIFLYRGGIEQFLKENHIEVKE